MTANKMPEDSTLRRHYETHLKMTGGGSGKSSAGSAPRSAPSSHTPAPAGGGGFMGWLKRLFGG